VPTSLMFFGLPHNEYAPLARRSEALGFEAVWLSDHLVTPLAFAHTYPYSASGDPGYRADTPLADVWVTLGHLAATTHRIRLGSGVYILPLRNPLVTARAAGMVQSLSGGRLIFGVGAGWQREEFDAAGEVFETRGARTDEILDILPRLWSGAPVEHAGRYYQFPGLQMAPAPPCLPPVIVGGASHAALRRTAHYGDGWFSPNWPLDQVRACRDQVEALRGATQRAGEPLTYYVRLFGGVDPDNVRRYADAGFDHLVTGLFSLPGYDPRASLDRKLASLETLASRVGLT
jgi:probable F420-dependent oxidoreductase